MNLNNEVNKLKQAEFDFIIKNGKRTDTIAGYKAKQLIYLPYSFVKDGLPTFVEKLDFEGLILGYLNRCGYNVFSYELENLEFKEVFKFICWVFDEYKIVNELERDHLSGDPEFSLIAAGVNRLNQFGDFNIIDCLAGGDLLKHEAIKSLPYHVIFDKQLKNKIDGEIQKNLQEIQREKSRTKKN